MNSIEDIAKMAIEEVGAELKELENSRIPTKAPKPLRAANDALNAIVKNDEAAQLNAASVMKENENTLNITNTNSKTFGAEIRVLVRPRQVRLGQRMLAQICLMALQKWSLLVLMLRQMSRIKTF